MEMEAGTKRRDNDSSINLVGHSKEDCCDESHMHPNHQSVLPRLKRVSGQIKGIERMIHERKYCPDIIQQVRAASSALKSVESLITEKHLESCVEKAIRSNDPAAIKEKIREIMEAIK